MPELMTGAGLWASRHVSPKTGAQVAQVMEETGSIDQMIVWDQIMNWFPQAIWEPEYAPMAEVFPDVDSVADGFTALAFALSGTDKLGFGIGCDALRREPAEMAQALLTMAMATEGQATLFLGAGEVRHISPFGRKRSIGLKRLEDGLQVLHKLLKEREPVDHDGTVWKMKDAFIGNGGKDKKPEVMGMGGGPRLIEATLKWADGWSAGAPFVYPRAEEYGEVVKGYRKDLENLGRDPEDFSFALHHVVFLTDDEEEFERACHNPLAKWYAATGGRFNQAHWKDEGLEPPLPLDYHYAFDMIPGSMSKQEILEICDRVPPEMVAKTFFHGTPEQIAAEIRPYVDAGADRHLVADVSALVIETDPMGAIRQLGEICKLIKQPVAGGGPVGLASSP